MSNKRFVFIVNFDDRYQIHYNYVDFLLISSDLSLQVVNDYVHRSQIIIVIMLYHLKLIDDNKYYNHYNFYK